MQDFSCQKLSPTKPKLFSYTDNYSSVLLVMVLVVRPLLFLEESEEAFTQKLQMLELIWQAKFAKDLRKIPHKIPAQLLIMLATMSGISLVWEQIFLAH